MLSFPLAKENAELLTENRRLEPLLQRMPQASSPVSADQQLDEFIRKLPKAGDINVILNRLHQLMERHHQLLKNSEYQKDQSKTGKITRLGVTLKMEGNYPDLVRFLQEIRQSLPALAVDQISLTRQKISDTKLDAVIAFSLYYSQAEM